MKYIISISLMFFSGFFSVNHLLAQSFNESVNRKVIEPYLIEIGFNITSNLIFPYPIHSVDKGSADILAQQAKGVRNILQVKAAIQQFQTTNLSVITSDGKFYSFLINYNPLPKSLNISFANNTKDTNHIAVIDGSLINDQQLDFLCNKVKDAKPIFFKPVNQQKMLLQLNGIYISRGLMFFRLMLKNKSLIDFQPGSIHFSIKDKKKAKKTTIQEKEIHPLAQPTLKTVGGNDKDEWILGFPAFAISKDKILIIRISDQSNGRVLTMPINAKAILRARKL